VKWIGQHIWDFISRFRNDVYLENISTGTIASGGNLGLDSNNMIVKATETTGDITGVDLTVTSPIIIADETGTTGGDYSATIGVNSASTTAIGVVELATTAEARAGTDNIRAVTAEGVAVVHATAQTGKNYRIVNTSFRQDIGTTKYYVPLKSQAEQTSLTREEGTELAVCDGRLVTATVRVESMGGSTGDFTLTMGVETNVVGVAYSSFSVIETETITANTVDDHHIYQFAFDDIKHWDSTDMFAISLESSSDEWGTNERFFITLVIEDDWSTYLSGPSREIDSTP